MRLRIGLPAAAAAFLLIAAGEGDGPRWTAPYDEHVRSDRLLEAFEVAHPACRIWSDWRKLCSHTGPGGSTYCKIETVYPAKPSAPFCGDGYRKGEPAAEAASLERFCVRRKRTYIRGVDRETPTGPYACVEYAPKRPFGGTTIEQMEHPACLVWGELGYDKEICRTGSAGNPALSLCSSPKARAFRTTNILACAKWIDPKPCPNIVGGQKGVEEGYDGIYFFDKRLNTGQSVVGTYC